MHKLSNGVNIIIGSSSVELVHDGERLRVAVLCLFKDVLEDLTLDIV